MNLRWTDAGRAALASADHVGTAALKLTHLALGDSHGAGGAADDSRTALRSERHRAALSGKAAAGKIAARADFEPDASYGVTEAGVFGVVGDPPGKAFLCLYWTDGGAEAAKAAKGTALAIAATLAFENSAADVTVKVAADITLGNVGEATDAKFGTTRYASQAEAEAGKAGNRAITPKGLKAAIGKVAAFLLGGNKAAADGTIYQLKGKADGGLLAEKRTLPDASATQKGIVELATSGEAKKGSDAARAVTPKALKDALPSLAPAPPDASTSKKGIVELADDDEAKKGEDGARAVTPKALKAALPSLAPAPKDASDSQKGVVELATQSETEAGTDAARAVTPKALKDALPKAAAAALLSGVPVAGKRYVLEGVAGGGVKLVLSSVLLATSTVSQSWQAAYTYAYNDQTDEDELQSTSYRVQAVRGDALNLAPGLWLLAAWGDYGAASRLNLGVDISVNSGGGISGPTGGRQAYLPWTNWPPRYHGGHGTPGRWAGLASFRNLSAAATVAALADGAGSGAFHAPDGGDQPAYSAVRTRDIDITIAAIKLG